MKELIEDIASAYHTVISELYEAGCRNVQLDDCTWGILVDENFWKTLNDDASVEKYVPLERLCVSPQCGFASTEEGNILTEEEQWQKLRLVREVAEEVWGK